MQRSPGMRLEPISDAPSMSRTRSLEEAGTGQRAILGASSAGGAAGTAVSRPLVLKPKAAKQYMQVSGAGI